MCAYACAAVPAYVDGHAYAGVHAYVDVHAYAGVHACGRCACRCMCVPRSGKDFSCSGIILHLIPLIEGQSMRLEIGRQPGNTNNPTVCLVTQLAPGYKLICPHRHFF